MFVLFFFSLYKICVIIKNKTIENFSTINKSLKKEKFVCNNKFPSLKEYIKIK